MGELATIEWTRFFDPPIPAIVLGSLGGVANFAVMGYFWLRSLEVRLKEKMVDRGFSAAEIERVVRVRPLSSQAILPPANADNAAYTPGS